MILWRNIENFYHFDSDPRFSPFLLYVRCKSGVTFVRRCFRDVSHLSLEGRILFLNIPVPGHCLSFTFKSDPSLSGTAIILYL